MLVHMIKNRIESIYFQELKGLRDVNITFNKPLTAIMGVNGSGKSTVLHALSCIFKPESQGSNYKFSYFFTPNPDTTWVNSKLKVSYSLMSESGNWELQPIREYKKDIDRWSPRYENRPARDTFYFGIGECIPEIEITNGTTYIDYKSRELDDKISKRVLTGAAFILNKEYTALTENKTSRKSLTGVRIGEDLKYTVLSMGTGEQRVIKILQLLHKAPAFSLILIDEIDLYLHVSALKKFIKVISDIASSKNFQVVFTTHSLVMLELKNILDIRYIEQAQTKSLVFDNVNEDMIYALSGEIVTPLSIYIEDDLSKTIVSVLLETLNLSSKATVTLYGTIENAFTLAAGIVLKGEDVTNTLVITDGDRYRTCDEKIDRMKKSLSGTEENFDEKVTRACSILCQYKLPDKTSPEKYVHGMLVESDQEVDVVRFAHDIHGVMNSHDWVDEILKRFNEETNIILKRIVDVAKDSSKWTQFTEDIYLWLRRRQTNL